MSKVLTLPENTKGRDFVVGDIHGCYDLLMEKLDAVNFDETVDRLISVGDIIDRGPSSILCATTLFQQPWFVMIKGNHEELFLLSEWYTGKDNHTGENAGPRDVHLKNGGGWILGVDESMLKRIHEDMEGLPDIIEVQYKGKKYGIIHAELPYSDSAETIDWEYVKQLVETQEVHSIKWGRTRAREETLPYAMRVGYKMHVDNIDTVYAGHTIMTNGPVKKDSTVLIDTGGYMRVYSPSVAAKYDLTVMELGTDV